MNTNVKLLGMTVMLSMTFAACSNDEVVERNHHDAPISFTTRVMTRATETKLENLHTFRVYADADGYDEMFIAGDTARKSENGSTYILQNAQDENYFWPSDVDKIRFWAYGPAGCDDKNDNIDIVPNITAGGQTFGDFTPIVEMVNGGKAHKDFVVAYTEAKRSETSGMAVKLDFKHALSQIVVNATCGAGRNVSIKGAWLMNAHGSGILAFNPAKADDGEGLKYKNYMEWKYADKARSNYGVVSTTPENLDQTKRSLISNQNSLMLIPQKIESQQITKASTVANYNGAYILLLCRVEVVHPGAVHKEEGEESNPAADAEEPKTHTHQLFPVNTSGELDTKEYGYTCVPIALDWQPGVKYAYNLEFCGKNSGAGIYPPNDVETIEGLPKSGEGLTIIERPSGKNPGDLVLDAPITFEVTVGGWEPVNDKDENNGENDQNTPMN
jgi:hypothetical protein